ncbi:MAG: hypothetical protein J0G28_09825 [Afipia sp.]|nr:hypothetical protein [Afipia sp.]
MTLKKRFTINGCGASGFVNLRGALKRFQAKHALGLDPRMDTGSREENATTASMKRR